MKIKTSPIRWMLLPVFLCMFAVTFSQTLTEKKQITRAYNQNNLLKLQSEYAQKAQDARQKAVTMAAEKGWSIRKFKSDSTFDELMAVSDDGQPLYYTLYNVDAAKSTRVNHLHTGGSLGLNLNGQNMTAHVWDGGPTRPTHQEFDGPGGNDRVTINDGVTTLNGNSFHSQHVTGTIVASGYVAAAKGMAPYAKALTHEWNNDLSEATAEAAKGMLVSNHSYGFMASGIPDYWFGAYIDESRDWDNLMYNAPYYLMVVAAGNDGNNDSSNGIPLGGNPSYDKLSGHATCKNNMVVANGQDANVNADGSLNSLLINSSSSEGPTDDYRIKPDITGNGTGVYSTYDGSDSEYNSITGTSMASPNVTGTLLILQQYYKQVNGSFMRAASLKGLALHTADDAGSAGPDPIYGWGLLNAKAAAGAITNNGSSSFLRELSLASGQTYTITLQSDGISPLKASISWTDPAGTANTGTANLTTPVLVNDLDIRVSQGNTTYNPWKLTGVATNATGDNMVDPFERVDVSNAKGTYTITVSHKGNLSGGSQNYTLIVTGLKGSVTNIPVTGVTLCPTSLSLTTGQTSALTSTVAPTNATNKNVTWASSNTSVATVSSSGVVTAVAVGSATITVTTQDGAKTATCQVSVTPSGNPTYCTIKGNTSNFYISNVAIGSLDNHSGNNNGYGDFTALSTTMEAGSPQTIVLTAMPFTSSEKWVVWVDYNQDGDFTDSGEEVVSADLTSSVRSVTFTVPANAAMGSTRMRVARINAGTPAPCGTFTDGEAEDYTVNIVTTVPVTGVSLNSEALSLTAGETATLMAKVSPSNASNQAVSWTSSNTSVATVSSSGVVTAVAAGSATITATTQDGSKTASCTVNVHIPVTGVSINPTSLTMAFGEIATLTATVKPSNATNKNVTWSSSTPGIYFESPGVIRAHVSGTAIITVTTEDGNKTASCLVTVSNNAVTYCTPTVGSSYQWIGLVKIGSINNATSKGSGYSDYTSMSTNMAAGSTQSINLVSGWATSGTAWKVWIDYNHNGDFTDSGEAVVDGSFTGPNINTSFTVPSAASLGATRMRVMMVNTTGSVTPCSLGDGEVEDYTVNITSATKSIIAENSGTLLVQPEAIDPAPAVSVYPNPASDKLFVSANETGKIRAIAVFDMLGKEYKVTFNSDDRSINVSRLSNGIYVLIVKTDKGEFRNKFTKQ